MKKVLPFLLLCAFLQASCNSSGKNDSAEEKDAKTEKKAEKISLLDYHAQDKSLNDLVAAEYAKGRTPVVYFWADWCGPCKEFKASLHDPLMEDALNNTTLIMIDLDRDSEKDNHSGTFGVDGIPAFVTVDKSGEMIDLVDGGAWDENIPENMAPVLKDFLAGEPGDVTAGE